MANIVYISGETGSAGSALQPKKLNLVLYRGDDFTITIAMNSRSGQAINFSDWVGECQFKKGASTIDADVEVKPDGLSFVLSIPSATVATMSGEYSYDVQFTYPDTTVRTYIAGKATVSEDVTQ